MTPTDLFRDYLLREKDVVLEVADKAAATYMLKLLRNAKQRYSRDMMNFGLEDDDSLREKTIVMDILAETEEGCKVRYYPAVPAPRSTKVAFKMLRMEDI